MKILQLVLMGYIYFLTGMILGINRTAGPDLQCVYNVQFDVVHYLLLAFDFTATIAFILVIFLIKRFRLYMVVAMLMVMYTIGNGLVAATHSIYVAWIGLLTTGCAAGASLSCCMVLCNLLFKTESYPVHILLTSVSAGAITGPLLAQLFLGEATSHQFKENKSVLIDLNINSNMTSNYSDEAWSYCETTYSLTNALYFIVATLALPAVIGSCLSYYKAKLDEKDENNTRTSSRYENKTGMYKTAYTLVVILALPITNGITVAFGNNLQFIGVQDHLPLTTSAPMTTIFWLLFAVGRLASTVLSIFVKQRTVLYVFLSAAIFSSVFLIGAFMLNEATLWVGTLSLAFSLGPGFAGLIAWSREYIKLNPDILCNFMFIDAVGAYTIPFSCSFMLSFFGVDGYLYFILSLCLLEMLLFVFAHYLGTRSRTGFETNYGSHDSDCELTSIVRDTERNYTSVNNQAYDTDTHM